MKQIPIRMLSQATAGVVTPPTISGPIPMPRAKAEPGELLSAMRDEERW